MADDASEERAPPEVVEDDSKLPTDKEETADAALAEEVAPAETTAAASDTAVAEEAVNDGDQLSDIEAEHVSAGHWDEAEPAVDDDATSAHNEQPEGHDVAEGEDVGQTVPADSASDQLEHTESDAAADPGRTGETASGDEEQMQQQHKKNHEISDFIVEEREEQDVAHRDEVAEHAEADVVDDAHSKHNVIEIAVARAMLGVVIGRGRETKNRIEHESGAHIQLLRPALDSDGENWTCRVTGGHEETARAAVIIQDLIDNSEPADFDVEELLSEELMKAEDMELAAAETDRSLLESPDGSISHADLDVARDSFDEDEEEEEHEMLVGEEAEPIRNRELLIEKYRQALAERQQLQDHNAQLQQQLAEMLNQRRPEDTQRDERATADQEKRYLNYMANLDGLHQLQVAKNNEYSEQTRELSALLAVKEEEVLSARQNLIDYKKQVALSAVNSRSGKPIPPQDVEQVLMLDNRKDIEVVSVRLENIKLRNKLKKQEAELKSKEELADGLHLIDFEQLKIENQTYNEKIEERNEELTKLRSKITNTVQIMTHLKEKLQFVNGENSVEKQRLHEVEELVAKKRDALSRTKQVRDGLRIENQRLQQSGGLLGNTVLLRDFEERHDDCVQLTKRLDELKSKHAELTVNTNTLRRKIDADKLYA